MIQIEQQDGGKLLVIHASGKLDKNDYQRFAPEFDRLIEHHGKVRVLFEMHDFHGWKPEALWEEAKVDFKHFSDIERVAMVGEKQWQSWMSKFCSPFTRAEIRYFDRAEEPVAEAWLKAA
ncbi:MAG TPA: STAS/SEC14 domain-containing protein [Verrucomicrobiae bacterium]|jgi:hypothetical protein|nr:STAS/SEC14 domain-containing protein [Verrucomicrobiae bacterium]